MSEEIQVGMDTNRSVHETEHPGGNRAAMPYQFETLEATGRPSLTCRVFLSIFIIAFAMLRNELSSLLQKRPQVSDRPWNLFNRGTAKTENKPLPLLLSEIVLG
jgi:hypothetical protein